MQKFLSKYIKFVQQKVWRILLVIFLINIGAFLIASKLELKSSLKELLPEDSVSVKALEDVIDKVGGVGNIIIAIESPDIEANKKFADQMALKFSEYPEGYIRYVDYKTDDVEKYYENHALHYLSLEDLKEVKTRLKRKVDYEKIKRSPLFLDLGDDAEVSLDISDIKEKYEKQFSAPVQSVDGYYGGDWGRLLIMIVRPYGANVSVDFAKDLINKINNTRDELKPETFHPQMSVGLTGTFAKTIEEYEALKNDILKTALLCIALVAGAIALYFLRLRPVFLLGATLLVSLTWTFAIVKLTIGYLNAQTAFLGAIIIGTGINYGIILFGRYFEERRKNKNPGIAMQDSIKATVTPTFLAAATTAVAFGVLSIAGIRSLSQFGFIGSMGIILCWLNTIFVLPVFILASEKARDFFRSGFIPKRKHHVFVFLAKHISRAPFFIVIIFIIAIVFSVSEVYKFSDDAIEYDFSKLQNKMSTKSGTDKLDRKVGRLFKHSTVPTVIYVGDAKQGREVCKIINDRVANQPLEERRVDSCYNVEDLLPDNQEEKSPVIASIRNMLSGSLFSKLDKQTRDKIRRLKQAANPDPVTINDLPKTLTRHFEDLEGNIGSIVFVNPRRGMWFSDGHNLIAFANTIRDIKLSNGTVVNAVGDSMIFSDLIEIIKDEAPILTISSLIAVLMLIFITIRRKSSAMIIASSLVCGVIIMLGIASLLELRINFFNFIVLPLTFGIAADYSLNIGLRVIRDKEHNLAHALRNTGGAVILCAATTMISYYVLTQASNQALASFGKAAIIGEISCIISALLLIPAMAVLIDRFAVRSAKLKGFRKTKELQIPDMIEKKYGV